MTREAISLDTIQGDVTNLGHLLDELVSKINDLDFVKPNGSRDRELDRIAALAWIARDIADNVNDNFSAARATDQKGIRT